MQSVAWEIIGLSGVASIVVGLWWLSPAASMVVLGVMFLAAGIQGATGGTKE